VPKETSGRANGVLNLFHFGGAFAVQYLIGVILALWPAQDGHYPPSAWQAAFAVNLLLQALALGYFLHARSRRRVPVAALRRLATLVSAAVSVIFPAAHRGRRRPATRSERFAAALRQVTVWRLAGLGSVSLAAGLSLTFAISAVNANALPGTVATPRDKLPAAPATVAQATPDAQIACALAAFVAEVRSLSTDPTVVRANWNDALSRVTRRGALALVTEVPLGKPFDWLRRRSVTVEVTGVQRTGKDTFEVRWVETILEDGTAPRRQYLRAAIGIALDPTAGMTFRNPLGLYVDTFVWLPDAVRDGE